MKTLVLISLLLISASLEERLAEVCETTSYSELEKNLNIVKSDSSAGDERKWSSRIKREIVSNYEEEIIIFRSIVPKSENVFGVKPYRINLIRKQDQIIYLKLTALVRERFNGVVSDSGRVLVEKMDDSKWNSLNSKYQTAYREALELDSLFQTHVVFGNRCGKAAMRPKYGRLIDEAVERRDTAFVFEWLRSPTTEKQLFAVQAVDSLEQLGVSLDKEITRMIKLVMSKKGEVRACYGRRSNWTMEEVKEYIFEKGKN